MVNKAKSVSGVTSDINVTPMADIMLVLLIIFMITTPLLQKGITVNLPKTKSMAEEMPLAEKKTAVVVGMDRSGKAYMGTAMLRPANWQDELVQKIKRARELNQVDGNKIFFKCDQSVPYESVVKVVEVVRDSGFDQIGLLVDQPKKKK